MKINIPPIDLGKLIFLHRIKKGLTQEQLAKAICSIPYLSKLENNKIEPSKDILIQLLNRIDIDIENVHNDYKDLIYILEKWYEAILIKDIHLIDSYKRKARNYQVNTFPPELTYFVQLLEIRYALYDKDLVEASKMILDMQKVKKNMSVQVLNYFNYFQGIFACLKSEYSLGKDYFLKAEQGFIEDKADPVPELQFHLSLANSHIYDISMAIHYANNAKQLFTQQLSYSRIIDCDLIIGINLIRQERYQEAEEKFNTLINMCKLNKYHHLCAKGLHNLAYLESQKRNHRNAIKYYRESLSYKEKNDNSYLNTLYFLSKEYLKLDETDTAYEIYDEIIKYYSTYNLSKEYYYKALIGKLDISKNAEELIKILEEEVIPYFEQKNNTTTLSKLILMAAEVFERERKYKKSCIYYKKYHDLTFRKGVINEF